LGGSGGIYFLSLVARMSARGYPGMEANVRPWSPTPESQLLSLGDIEAVPREPLCFESGARLYLPSFALHFCFVVICKFLSHLHGAGSV
jgi:hypothetical protein